jgi:hypothetical protein
MVPHKESRFCPSAAAKVCKVSWSIEHWVDNGKTSIRTKHTVFESTNMCICSYHTMGQSGFLFLCDKSIDFNWNSYRIVFLYVYFTLSCTEKCSPIITEEGTHTFVLRTGMARLQGASAVAHLITRTPMPPRSTGRAPTRHQKDAWATIANRGSSSAAAATTSSAGINLFSLAGDIHFRSNL